MAAASQGISCPLLTLSHGERQEGSNVVVGKPSLPNLPIPEGELEPLAVKHGGVLSPGRPGCGEGRGSSEDTCTRESTSNTARVAQLTLPEAVPNWGRGNARGHVRSMRALGAVTRPQQVSRFNKGSEISGGEKKKDGVARNAWVNILVERKQKARARRANPKSHNLDEQSTKLL